MTAASSPSTVPVLRLGPEPAGAGAYVRDLWRYRHVLRVLTRTSFHVRYKRSALGIAWAIVVPLVQAATLAFVFSRIAKVPTGAAFGAYVLSGVLAWTFFNQSLSNGATAIVDQSSLADKVWFPRALLPTVTALANLPGFAVTVVFLIGVLPLLGASISTRLLLLPLAAVLMLAFTVALSLVLSALQVYVRDLRFLVQAALVLWFYVTPVAYPKALLGSWASWFDLNPMTGVVTAFRVATIGHEAHWQRPVLFAALTTVALFLLAIELHRRNDRLFIDLL